MNVILNGLPIWDKEINSILSWANASIGPSTYKLEILTFWESHPAATGLLITWESLLSLDFVADLQTKNFWITLTRKMTSPVLWKIAALARNLHNCILSQTYINFIIISCTVWSWVLLFIYTSMYSILKDPINNRATTGWQPYVTQHYQ